MSLAMIKTDYHYQPGIDFTISSNRCIVLINEFRSDDMGHLCMAGGLIIYSKRIGHIFSIVTRLVNDVPFIAFRDGYVAMEYRTLYTEWRIKQ